MSRSMHTLNLLRHRLTNAAKHLHHCMLVNQLQCMTPSKRFGFLLLWYLSYHGTAIKYAPAMVPHTTTHGDTSVNAVSKQPTLSQVAQLPHCRLQQDTLFSGTTSITSTCTMHAAYICCTCITGNPDETGSSCSHHTSCSEECPGTNACDIPYHTCAAMKIQLCLHGTKMPYPRDLGTINQDCPWTLLSLHTATYIPSKLFCHVS